MKSFNCLFAALLLCGAFYLIGKMAYHRGERDGGSEGLKEGMKHQQRQLDQVREREKKLRERLERFDAAQFKYEMALKEIEIDQRASDILIGGLLGADAVYPMTCPNCGYRFK